MGPGELADRMRSLEADSERVAAPGHFVVVRLDGRGFGKLLRARHDLDRPLDVRVRDILIATADHLMNCEVPVVYAYTQSDEVTLLLRREGARGLAASGARLAAEASGKCTLLLGALASFTAKVVELPDAAQVVEYFQWRQDEAVSAAVRAHAAWGLQQGGASEPVARERVAAASQAELDELLAALKIDATALPGWQTGGVGLVWERPEPAAVNPRTGAVVALRRRVRVLLDLDHEDEYAALLRTQAERAAAAEP